MSADNRKIRIPDNLKGTKRQMRSAVTSLTSVLCNRRAKEVRNGRRIKRVVAQNEFVLRQAQHERKKIMI
jgi:hypothetical protein